MGFYLILVRIVNIKKITTTKCGRDVGKKGPLHIVDRNASWCSHCENQYRDSSSKPENKITIPPSHTWRTLSQHVSPGDTHASIFMPFKISKIWSQPRPSKRWTDKEMWENICTIQFCSAIIKNEIRTFTSKWIELEITVKWN